MYRITLTSNAYTQLAKLENASRIVDALERIRVRPKRFCRRLVGSPYYRLRIGDYRAIIDIRDDELVILVIEVAYRSTVYR